MSAVRDTSQLRTFTGVAVRDAGNVARTILSGSVRGADNVLRTIFSALSLSTSKTKVVGVKAFGAASNVTTESVTVTVTGGVAPLTYFWEDELGSDWTVANSTAATTTFTALQVEAGDTATNRFRCIVTDASGATATSAWVEAAATNIGKAY